MPCRGCYSRSATALRYPGDRRNSVGAAVFGAILNFGINQRIPEAADAVNRLLDPTARLALGAAQITRLSEAMAASLQIVYVVAGLCRGCQPSPGLGLAGKAQPGAISS